jgi:hypothetical protein
MAIVVITAFPLEGEHQKSKGRGMAPRPGIRCQCGQPRGSWHNADIGARGQISWLPSGNEVEAITEGIGYPVRIKASAGGGKGMRIAYSNGEVAPERPCRRLSP